MFNLKAIANVFGFTPVEAGSFETKEGFVLTLRPAFDATYAADASTSFVDAEDLYHSSMEYYDRKQNYNVSSSMATFVSRLEAKKESAEYYTQAQLLEFVTKYENMHTATISSIYFYAQVRKELVAEFERLGIEGGSLEWLFSVADEVLYNFKQYN